MKRIITPVLAALVVLGVVSCSGGGDNTSSGTPTSASDAVATINGEPILLGQVDRVVAQWRSTGQAPVDLGLPITELRKTALQQLVDRMLLYQAASAKGYVADSLQVEQMLGQFRAQFPSEEAQANALRPMGLDYEGLRQIYKQDLTIQHYIQLEIVPTVDVSPEACRSFYEQNKMQFNSPEKVRARHILFTLSEDATPEQEAEARSQATLIMQRARNGEDFAELAKEYSQGPSAPHGGDLGYFEQGRMVPPFDQAAFSMKVGEISEPVRTQFGYHIIKLEDRQAAGSIPFDQAVGQIRANLQNQSVSTKVQQVVQELREGADIESNL